MKASLKHILPAILLILIFVQVHTSCSDSGKLFPDATLELVVREAIQKPFGEIEKSDLEGLNNLSAYSRGIKNLSGLEYCINLTDLHLGRNEISDVKPLANLTGIERLYLESNKISDITPLSNLTNLTQLHLGDNNLKKISALSDLTGLTRLWLGDNQIRDITPLSNLINLNWLGLYNSGINDVAPLANLPNLTVINLERNSISDIAPLISNGGIGDGDTVDLRDNPLSEASITLYIPQLEARGVIVSW